MASAYGAAFDSAVHRWSVIENAHDKQHPDRSQCGGVGGCSMMAAAVDLEHEMVDALDEWRRRVDARPDSVRSVLKAVQPLPRVCRGAVCEADPCVYRSGPDGVCSLA